MVTAICSFTKPFAQQMGGNQLLDRWHLWCRLLQSPKKANEHDCPVLKSGSRAFVAHGKQGGTSKTRYCNCTALSHVRDDDSHITQAQKLSDSKISQGAIPSFR